MPTYIISGPGGSNRMVKAMNETHARYKAMVERWGPPKPLTQPIPNKTPTRYTIIGDPDYVGYGLSVERVKGT